MADALSLAPRDLAAYVEGKERENHHLTLLIEGAHCANCIARIENSLKQDPTVKTARLNLSSGQLRLEWTGKVAKAGAYVKQLEELGFGVQALEPEKAAQDDTAPEKKLLRALAVAGFGAANIMLMSVAIWSGAADDPATRSLFSFLSAVIAVPVVAYAGLPFFRSAYLALKAKTTNMDVPISLAVLLSVGLSLVQMAQGGKHVWFESATMLLFFLLIGRLLDARARGKAESAVSRLLKMRMIDAHVISGDGNVRLIPSEQVEPGMMLQVPMGAQVPVDGTITEVKGKRGSLDTSLITGESLPRDAHLGDKAYAGTINMGAPLTLRAEAVKDDTLLADITRLMAAAEQKRGKIVVLADRIARAYVPVVHTLAAASFIFWLLIMSASLPHALEITIAVLVITCPCALALAVPVVQVLASTKLMQQGILLKSATALERLAQIDMVVFDKTGTLTLPHLTPDISGLSDAQQQAAAALASASGHPLAKALTAALPDAPPLPDINEHPGNGMSAKTSQGEMRLGRAEWIGAEPDKTDPRPELWLALPGTDPLRIPFNDQLRPDAAATIAALNAEGLHVELLSGDRAAAVQKAAKDCGIAHWQGDMRPEDKAHWLHAAEEQGHKILMIGDGLNDGPALSHAYVSLSPASGTDIAQTTADAVFQGTSLRAVTDLLEVARRAQRLAHQNIGFAILYNLFAVPAAMAGFVTPLLAAIAMSSSSILVTLNAFRLSLWRKQRQEAEA